ncbi:sulfate/molybdate ABC transporter ATP-binding protein [Mycolicibacterium komossense]|uniref:ATP-binding cassette domain-containing protein n=1 Tax=Mycolicibacterium komossense TaxID=1779 RepID=A0ABT3C9X4_9MYCO|nr:ATP-binding cassette domain-containing protein [Mycolicibacterium komossense]MCV7226274.1 ATP-binding cassette domain-containing protein [Mycolicibacterium komossense]
MTGLQVRAVLAERDVDMEFGIAAGEVLAILGPNGAGKSTALHVISGLVRPDRGYVRLGDRVLTDTDAGVFVPTYDRRVGLLLQDPLLFPHMTVAANVAFSPRLRRRGKAGARQAAQHWLAEVDAEQFVDRKPRQLSGGQAQRVAIARALAGAPDVLLLDEPMAGLDVAAAAAIRALLRRVLTSEGRAAVLVTHDVLDVLTLADRVMVIEAGRIAEIGAAAQVLTAPRSAFGARIAGVNLINGSLEVGGVLRTESGTRWHGVPAEGGEFLAVGQRAVAVFPPAAVAVFREQPHGSPRNMVEVVVAELDSRGAAIRVRAGSQADGAPGLAADITPEAAAELRVVAGMRLWLAVKAQEVAIHPVFSDSG